MKSFVQILNPDEGNAVRFAFDDAGAAELFASALNAAFATHQVNSVVGSYNDGEVCPALKAFAEKLADDILKAAGSGLRFHTMPSSRDAIIAAAEKGIDEARASVPGRR